MSFISIDNIYNIDRMDNKYSVGDMFDIRIRSTIALVLASYLALHGYKKKSLNISGATSAFLVGFISFLISLRFGLLLIIFYYTSSKFTKLNEKRKAELEDNYQVGGQRNAIQVLANSALATMIAVTYWLYIGEDEQVFFVIVLIMF